MSNRLFLTVPEEAYILVFVLGAFMVMLGFRQKGFALLGTILLIACLGPVFDTFFSFLPDWAFIIILLFLFFSIIKVILGQGVWDHVVGLIIFTLVMTPFRIFGWMIRCLFNGTRV